MHKASDAGHVEPHGMRRCLSFSYQRLTPGSRAPAEGGAMLALHSPRLDRQRRVGPTFAYYVSRMLPQVGPTLALRWPMSALRWPKVGPILPLCWPSPARPYLGPVLPNHVDEFCRTMLEHLQHVNIFRPGPPLDPKTT